MGVSLGLGVVTGYTWRKMEDDKRRKEENQARERESEEEKKKERERWNQWEWLWALPADPPPPSEPPLPIDKVPVERWDILHDLWKAEERLEKLGYVRGYRRKKPPSSPHGLGSNLVFEKEFHEMPSNGPQKEEQDPKP